MTNDAVTRNVILQNQIVIMQALSVLLFKLVIAPEYNDSFADMFQSPTYQLAEKIQERYNKTQEFFEQEKDNV